ncbi:MAG: FG-GAP-like repeat-containing protein [candidate division KSB1 bacterium]
MIIYDLGRYIENGSLEIRVKKFEPTIQVNTASESGDARHHVLAMFRTHAGSHHIVENLETAWDFHTGKLVPVENDPFQGGIKLLSWTYGYSDEKTGYVTDGTSDWNINHTPYYQLKFVWDNSQLAYFRDGVSLLTHTLDNPMQLRYLYVGRDRTMSGDFVTNFQNNQYPAMYDAQGPIYSNLIVKETRPADTIFPTINLLSASNLYENAARLSWSTSEAAVCYVKYGLTTAYGEETDVLGSPEVSFSTLLPNLNAGTLYHCQIVAEDNAGNVTASNDFTFTTTTDGIYAFQPIFDTYIEASKDANSPWLYGETRGHANFGWTNLMTSLYRDCFFKFNVAGVSGNIASATLRLHGRQSGATGGILKQFTPNNSNWENNATWNDAISQSPQYIARSNYIGATQLAVLNSITGNQWHDLDVSSVSRDQNNNYYFVLQGTGTPDFLSCGALDSRESTNYQPELIIETAPSLFTEVTTSLLGVVEPGLAWGDFDKDRDLDLVLTGDAPGNNVAFVYRYDGKNNGNHIFTPLTFQNAPLPLVTSGAVAWSDFDDDNFLDFAMTGYELNVGDHAKIFNNNDNGSFVETSSPLTPVATYGAVAWGDYNNDRHTDILISGYSNNQPFTKLYKATGQVQWTATVVSLAQLGSGTVAFGDYDKDRDLDILLSGLDANQNSYVKVYRNKFYDNNTGPNFASFQQAWSVAVGATSCVWGDYDQDGDLDIALTGNGATRIYKYDGASFVLEFTLEALYNGNVAWGDYDNDGDLDLLLTGTDYGTPNIPVSKIYRNDQIAFNEEDGASFTGVYYSSGAWGDFDNDGDLDLILAGVAPELGFDAVTKLYENNTSTPNNPPGQPTMVAPASGTVLSTNTVTLSWNPPANADETPTSGLTYNILLGKTNSNFTQISPMALTSDGYRLLPAMGNVDSNTSWTLTNLPDGVYYWRVQAIDQTFKGSTFQAAQSSFSFTIATGNPASSTDFMNEPSLVAETEKAATIPEHFFLSETYPNPFNLGTQLNLDLPEDGHVLAIIFDLQGKEVVRLREEEMRAGYNVVQWDGRNVSGEVASSATYFVKVVFESRSGKREETTRRLVLVK